MESPVIAGIAVTLYQKVTIMATTYKTLTEQWLTARCTNDSNAITQSSVLLNDFNTWRGSKWPVDARVFKRDVLSIHPHVEWIRRNSGSMVVGLALSDAR